MTSPTHFPTRAHVLVCTGPSCARRGGRELFRALWTHAEREGIAYYAGGHVRLTESGCQGACEHGPNAIVYRRRPGGDGLSEAWFAGLDLDRSERLLGALDAEEALPEDGRYG